MSALAGKTERDLLAAGGRSSRRWTWALALACVLALFVEAYARAVLRFAYRPWDPFDLGIYRDGGLAVLHHSALYSLAWQGGARFTYPPFAAVLFTALSARAGQLEAVIVFVANLALLVLCLWRMGHIAGRPLRWRWLMVMTVLVLPAEPTTLTLSLGQINLLIAALVICDLSLAEDSRWRGVMIGIAAGLKLTTLIFVAYLLITGRWRQALTASGSFLVTILVSFAVVPHDARSFWLKGLFLQPARTGITDTIRNQSLLGSLERLGIHGSLVTVISAMVGICGLVLVARFHRDGDRLLAFALCAVTGLLLSPISWVHHWVILMPVLPYLMLRREAWVRIPAVLFGVWTLLWPLLRAFPPQRDLMRIHTLAQQLDASSYVLAGVIALMLAGGYQLRAGSLRGSPGHLGWTRGTREPRVDHTLPASAHPSAE